MDVSIGKELELKFLIPIKSLTFTNMILSMLLTTRVSRQKKMQGVSHEWFMVDGKSKQRGLDF